MCIDNKTMSNSLGKVGNGRHVQANTVTATRLQTTSMQTATIVTGSQPLSSESVLFTESSDVHDDPGAGRGRLWVLDSSPNDLIFTDDEGTDFNLVVGGRGVRAGEDLATVLDNGNDANELSINNLDSISFSGPVTMTGPTTNDAVLIGNGAFGIGTNNIAIGRNARTTNMALTPVANGIAIGHDSKAYTGGIAIARLAKAGSAGSIAIGANSSAAGNYAIAIGNPLSMPQPPLVTDSVRANYAHCIVFGAPARVNCTGTGAIALNTTNAATVATDAICLGSPLTSGSVGSEGILMGTGTVGANAIAIGGILNVPVAMGTVPANELKIALSSTTSLQTNLMDNVRGTGAVSLPTDAEFITVTIGGVDRRIQLFTTA